MGDTGAAIGLDCLFMLRLAATLGQFIQPIRGQMSREPSFLPASDSPSPILRRLARKYLELIVVIGPALSRKCLDAYQLPPGLFTSVKQVSIRKMSQYP